MAFYLILCAIVVFALVDFHSLAPFSPAYSHGSDGPAVSDAPWPHYRGSAYDGRSGVVDLASAWPASGPPVLWSREIGAGYGGMIAVGGRVYAQTQTLTEQKVIALDADTGRTIWEHSYGWPYQPAGMFPGPRATPAWADGRIYFAAPNGLVGCLDAADGRSIWSVNVVQQFGGRGASFGYACSPVVEDKKVILPVGGPSASVVALDADTGQTRWKSGSAPASYCSALPITFHGRRQIVAFLQNSLAGFDLQSGQLLWEQAYAPGRDEHAAAVLYDEPFLRTMQAYRAGSDLYELQAGLAAGEKDGVPPPCHIKRLRHDGAMSNDVASSVLVDGFVYGFDLRDMQASGGRPSRGTFRCMDFKTGQVRWSSERPGHAGIIVADGRLLMLNDRGEALLVRADPNRYDELARAAVFPGETCWTAPALYGGRLYLRSPTRAACLFVGNPQHMTPRQRALAMPLSAIRQAAPADLSWLLGGDREGPLEMPDARELRRWHLFSLAALAAAALLAGMACAASRLWLGRWSRLIGLIVFLTALGAFGIAATPIANHYSTQFIFTWPLALLAAHQVALAAVVRPKQSQAARGREIAGYAGALLLVLTCVLYFKLTRHFNLASAWYFLAALPIASIISLPAARRLSRPGRFAIDILWMLVIFSIYFWVCGGVMLLRTAWY
ncbi:MAG TPA: PQQ-binding-like beta-propeller repeat protein [Tepidisphaeraceae bacterium]|jgi:outer membrane protein assembly factor BamB|nr:PQQ-binding-like beta-propeller repeat protein [Tepidisphaeraceae bacterium]